MWAVSAIAKYVGILLAFGLGIVATFTDTREKDEKGRYRLLPVGRYVVIALILSALAALIGQHGDDEERAVQLDHLMALNGLQVRQLTRSSGNLTVRVQASIPMSGPDLKEATRAFERRAQPGADVKFVFPDKSVVREYYQVFDGYDCYLSFSPKNQMSTTFRDRKAIPFVGFTPAGVEIDEVDPASRLLSVMFTMQASTLIDGVVHDADDLVDRTVSGRCGGAPEFFGGKGYNLTVKRVDLIDTAFRSELATTTQLKANADGEFSAQLVLAPALSEIAKYRRREPTGAAP